MIPLDALTGPEVGAISMAAFVTLIGANELMAKLHRAWRRYLFLTRWSRMFRSQPGALRWNGRRRDD